MLPISFNINYSDFTNNPYPVFAKLRNSAPISFVPELDAILLTKHSDIFICEKGAVCGHSSVDVSAWSTIYSM